MYVRDMNWLQVEAYLQRDDRCLLPLGSVEQHGHLSLCTDQVLAERVAQEAAAPLGVPVFPALPYGLAPSYQAFPGSMTLRVDTYVQVVRELLDGLRRAGFRRVLIVNGHGGNGPAAALAAEYVLDHPELRIKFHEWWAAPKTWAAVQAVDAHATHASWMENFPWTRLAGVALPSTPKPSPDLDPVRALPAAELRERLGDGSYGGAYEKPDVDMLKIWAVAVAETRALVEEGWGAAPRAAAAGGDAP